jgi:hypothetical protein
MQLPQRHTGLPVHHHQGLHDMFDEGVGRWQAGVHHVVAVELGRAVARAVGRVVQQIARGIGRSRCGEPPRSRLHRLDGGARVAGHFDLGDDFDVARGGKAQDLCVVGRAVVAAAIGVGHIGPGAIGRRQVAPGVGTVAAPRAKFGQFRQAGNGQAPAFVVRQVQVQLVELEPAHQVQQAQHRGLGVEVARHVQQQAAVFETRCVAQAQGRQQQRRAAAGWPARARAATAGPSSRPRPWRRAR